MSTFRGLRNALLIMSMGVGLWFLGSAGWIYAKAYAATFLIEDAWEVTLINQEINRPWSWADTWPVAKITIPSVGMSEVVLAGDSGASLAFGPGLSSSGAELDSEGVKLISAHRDTHFRDLQKLTVNDDIFIKTVEKDRHYRVVDMRVVDSRSYQIDSDTPGIDLVLATCYPFNTYNVGGYERYIVRAIEV